MNADELKEVLDKHKKWLFNEDGGILANLRVADLRGADLRGAHLRVANLRGANLRGAKNINTIDWNVMTAFYAIACHESGAFIAWKKASGYIVKMRIPEDAKRSSATSRKCRCSKAEVLAIETLDGQQTDLEFVKSDFDGTFVYRVGEVVDVADFDDDRWNECSTGIHFFITRDEAVRYGV